MTEITTLAEAKAISEKARAVLFARLCKERAVDAGRWTREDSYDDAT